MITVAVGSENPVKVEAARRAFAEMFGEMISLQALKVPSGVSDQPMTAEEALTGAIKRALSARSTVHADYGVGLEGGLIHVIDSWFCVGWAVVADELGRSWAAPGLGVQVPHEVMALVAGGLELGDAEDQVFGRVNSKQTGGLIGIVTEDRISRVDTFYPPLLTALCSLMAYPVTWPGVEGGAMP
jgi:inosine/xanthosine triphosphatase